MKVIRVAASKVVQPRLRAGAGKGLGAVYLEAGLPPVLSPARLPPGERRMLEKQQLSGFVQELHSPTPTAALHDARKKHQPFILAAVLRGSRKGTFF